MVHYSYHLSCQTQYNNFLNITGKRALKTNSVCSTTIRDCPYSTSFIKHTQTQAFSST